MMQHYRTSMVYESSHFGAYSLRYKDSLWGVTYLILNVCSANLCFASEQTQQQNFAIPTFPDLFN